MGRPKKTIQRCLRKEAPAYVGRSVTPPDVDQCLAEHSFEENCLTLLFDIFAQSGLSVNRLRLVSDRILATLKVSRRVWNPDDLYYFDRLAHVLSLWHLLRDYVDQGLPRAIPFRGRGPSLSKLIERVYPQERPRTVLETLVRVGAVRTKGRLWLPTGRTLVFQSPRVARLRILSDLAHFLETAQHNVKHPTGKLLQQTVFNPAVPVAELANVDSESVELAKDFLVQLDAVLDRRARNGRNGDPVIGSGIGVYAYRAKGWAKRVRDDVRRRRGRREKRS